ncbi:iron-containing redox enzyme family protein [Bdellovibrio sp. HCB337]|uniref:iron-containing redox enzyme family protein n=1 Tax=Bdellovibrio sp. HCB337 TaxID=3394358 RepID=UPI0039A450C8
MSEQLSQLQRLCTETWDAFKAKSEFFKLVQDGLCDRRLYALLLIQTYHYTRHNAINQAMVCQNPKINDFNYMKYCLDHAQEEVGHEMMAFHDLKHAGFAVESPSVLPKPSLETDIFVAYVYYISQTGNPVQRLGYSFWAEDAYDHIMPTLQIAAQNMKLKKSAMTFFIDHAAIDQKHSEDVHKQILRVCKTQDDWDAVKTAMLGTLTLTHRLLEGIARDYSLLVQGKLPHHEFLGSETSFAEVVS